MKKNNLSLESKIKPKEKYDLSYKIEDFVENIIENTFFITGFTLGGGVLFTPFGAGIGAGYSFLQTILDKNPNYERIMYGMGYGSIIGFGLGAVYGLTTSICRIRREKYEKK